MTRLGMESGGAFAQAFRKLRADPFALSCLWFLVVCAACCFCAPLIAPYPYEQQNLALGCAAPSAEHIFGTDMLGRDVLSRILYGGRISFAVGILATAVAAGIGTLYGMVSGMAGGRADALMMRLVDIIYSLPFTIFVILLTLAFGRSIWLIFVAIGAVEWLTMARIVRAVTLDLKSRQFVEASAALGQSRAKIMLRHILPNAAGSILVCATLTVPSVMLLEAFLSFLGLGVQAPLPSWGSLVKDGAEYMEDAPWLLAFPALFFSATLLALNRVGETLSRGEK
ncbi:MAG: ABC transporter permease [Opitutales bacterium]|nr:ABC transporter permease [Opitutales bacterium]